MLPLGYSYICSSPLDVMDAMLIAIFFKFRSFLLVGLARTGVSVMIILIPFKSGGLPTSPQLVDRVTPYHLFFVLCWFKVPENSSLSSSFFIFFPRLLSRRSLHMHSISALILTFGLCLSLVFTAFAVPVDVAHVSGLSASTTLKNIDYCLPAAS